MDRISDSGSDDYGSTPYGDTLINPQFSDLHWIEDFSFIFTCILRANTLSQSYKTFYFFVEILDYYSVVAI